MPKPVYVPVWATDATYVGGAEAGFDTKVASVEGPTQGWRPAAEPPAEEWNYWANAVGQWCDWLNVFESTAHTWTATQTFDIVSTDFISVTGQGIDLTTGDYFWETPIPRLHGPAEWFRSANHTHSADRVLLAADAEVLYLPLRVDVGDVITGFRVRARKTSTGSTELKARVVTSTDGTGVPGSDASNGANNPGLINIDLTEDTPVVAGKSYYLSLDQASGTLAAGLDSIYVVELYVTHPQP